MSWTERLKVKLTEIESSSKKRQKKEKASYTSLKLEDERFMGIRNCVSELLQEVNLEALDDRGSVIDWHKTETDKHSHKIMGNKWSHSSTQIETRFLMPEVGEVIVFAPTRGRPEYGGISASHIHVLSIGMRDRGGKGRLCDQVGKRIPLGHSGVYVSEKLKEILSEEIVRIHKAALR